MDLTGLTMAELRAVRSEIDQALKAGEQEEIAKAREQILAIAKGAGISLKELLKSQSQSKFASPKTKVATRYQHPSDSSLNWTGRGRQPDWVKTWLASGHTREELLITKA